MLKILSFKLGGVWRGEIILMYMYVRARVCECKKYAQKFFCKKVVKKFGCKKISPYLCSIKQQTNKLTT